MSTFRSRASIAAFDKGFSVDVDGFKLELQKQKERARKARGGVESMNSQNEEYMNFKVDSVFVGYETLTCESKVVGLFKDGHFVDEACGEVIAIFDNTPFYAESGGQIGDQGTIILNNESFNVLNTIKFPNGQHAHIIDMKDSNLKLGLEVSLAVDESFRNSVACNHSATHLLNEALRKVLGSHVVQQGSLVSNEYLRFDFNNYENLTNEELLKIEGLVNEQIKLDSVVNTILTNIEDAKKRGAQAVFGEKYGDVVRLVEMGYSKELCGGTHAKRTSDLEKFAILGIESKGSGIFRIEAATKDAIKDGILTKLSGMSADIKALEEKRISILEKAQAEGFDLKSSVIIAPSVTGSYADILAYRNKVEEARNIVKELDKEFDNLYRAKNSSNYTSFLDQAFMVGETTVILANVEHMDTDVVKDIIDKLSADLTNCVIMFASVQNGKIVFIAKSKGNQNRCGDIVKTAAIITGGNGGGRPDFAQAGGRDASKVDEALLKVKEMIK